MSMYPQWTPILTAANPSEKSLTSSNRKSIAFSPSLLIYPNLLRGSLARLIDTLAYPSLKLLAV